MGGARRARSNDGAHFLPLGCLVSRGACLDRYHFGAVSWALLACFWALLACFALSWGFLALSGVSFWVSLGTLGSLLASFGTLLAFLGNSWAGLGLSWAFFFGPLGPRNGKTATKCLTKRRNGLPKNLLRPKSRPKGPSRNETDSPKTYFFMYFSGSIFGSPSGLPFKGLLGRLTPKNYDFA